MSATRPMLEAEGLTRLFRSGDEVVRAVDGVDLRVAAGELVVVMGPSGSGKTTLLSMAGGMLRPSGGRVLVDGIDVGALGDRDRARLRRETVGFVFQSFNLLEHLSARENVEVALDIAGVPGPEARARAAGLLRQAGLGARLSFRARDLSGGERQRVAVARAVANHPRLLLVDEPTANLDSRQGGAVMRLLRDMASREGSAVLVVSHDERLVRVADRVLWMEDGRITARPPVGDGRQAAVPSL